MILGAWGCGVFGNDPHTVCRLLVKRRPEGMNVIFAIPDQENFDAFAEEMNKTDIPVKQTIRSFIKSHGWQMECPLIPMVFASFTSVNKSNGNAMFPLSDFYSSSSTSSSSERSGISAMTSSIR